MRLSRARKGLPYPLGVLFSKSLLQPQEPSRNRHDTRLKKREKGPFSPISHHTRVFLV